MNNNTNYEAIGFIEALIAILLVGVSSLILLQIAINTLNNAIQNEAIDHMTQYAMEGAEMAQDIYNKHKMDLLSNPDIDGEEEKERYFPEIIQDGANCFVINKRGGDVFFVKDSLTDDFLRYRKDVEIDEREIYREGALITGEGEEEEDEIVIDPSDPLTINISNQFFRIVCLEGDLNNDKPFMIARVVVGQRYFSEELFDGDLY